MSPRSGRRPRRRRKKLDSEVEGDAFLLQVSVILCTVAALAWSLLQVVLYQGTEPQMVAIPLFYPAAVFPTAWYERYRLHRRPYKHLARVHLTMVCVLPALLQIESGGFARSGGVISWSSVSPFTACVIAKKISKAWNWGALWMAVIAFAYGYEAYNETHDRHGASVIAQAWHTGESFHVVRVWTWQIYFYALATKVGVTLNACLLMYLLRNKTDNAVQAHKMLACAIMPPPVAKEVFEIQWKRLRDGRRASKASKAATSTPGRVSAASRVDSLRASETAADGIRDLALYGDTQDADIEPADREDMSALAVQERELEAKMRAEVLAKRRSALSGKANAKEWNYTAYQHRSRRIEPALGAARGVDLERATRDRVALAEKKKKMENNARRW